MKDLYVLEIDGKKYGIVNNVELNDNMYLYLCNVEDPDDFCFRKMVKEGNEEFLDGLDSDEEFDNVLKAFAEKNSHNLENN